MLRNMYRHARDSERAIRVGDLLRFPLGNLGSDDVYPPRWEVTSFTMDGCVNVRRLHDGITKTLAPYWIERYTLETDVRTRPLPARQSMREYRKAHPHTATRKEGHEFFVSVENNGRHAFLAGPYETHDEALYSVVDVRRLAASKDARSPWYSFGTCSAPVGLIEQTTFGKVTS